MNLTINDFRSVLGNANDGKVVFKGDGSGGIEKANHGNMITRIFRDYRWTANDPEENRQIRRALMDAISNSAEGKLLDDRQIDLVKAKIGITTGTDGSVTEVSADALTRQTLKDVLDTVELMARGEDIPNNGNVAEAVKGVPDVTKNKLIAAQIEELNNVGYATDRNKGEVVRVAQKHAQSISGCMSERFLNELFGAGYLGHSRKEMMIFVRESAAHIQSQIFDKLLWKYFDAVENHPTRQGRINLESGKASDVFKEVVREMMEQYAQGRDPLPKTATMLKCPDEPAGGDAGEENLPSLGDTGSQMERAGSEFLKKSAEKLERIPGELLRWLEPSAKSDFNARQVKSFVRQLKNAFAGQTGNLHDLKKQMYETFIDTFKKTAGDAETKQLAAKQAVDEFIRTKVDGDPQFAVLDRKSAELLGTLADSKAAKTRFFQKIVSGIAERPTDQNKTLNPTTIKQIVSGAVREIASLADLDPLVRALASNLGVEERNDGGLNEIRDALEKSGGKIAEFTKLARKTLVESRISDEKTVPLACALNFLRAHNDFVKLVEGKLSAGQGAEVFQKARNEQFAAIGKLKDSSGRPHVDDCILSKAELKNKINVEIGKIEYHQRELKELEKIPEKIRELEQALESKDRVWDEDEKYKTECRLELLKDSLKGSPKKIADEKLAVEDAQLDYEEVLESHKGYDEKYYGVVGEYRDIDDVKAQLDEEDKRRAVSFTREERETRFNEMKAKLEASQIVRGKLQIVLRCGLIDERPEVRKQLANPHDPSRFLITPENLELAMETVEELLAGRPLSELKALGKYITEGGLDKDIMIQFGKQGTPWRFRNMYLDGRFDNAGVDSRAQAYLGDCIDDNKMRLSGNGVLDIIPRLHVPDGVFNAYYRELRQAVVDVVEKLNRGLKDRDKLDLQTVLDGSNLVDENPPDANADFFRWGDCYDDEAHDHRFSIRPFKTIYGFGTNDPVVQNDILGRVGLSPADLNTADGWLKAQRLMVLVKMHGGRADGVVEWAERVIGKPFAEMTFSDLIEKAAAIVKRTVLADPAETLKGDAATIARFLGGEIQLSEAKLKPSEMPKVLAGLRALETRETSKSELILFDRKVSVERLPNGALTARLEVGDGKTMPLGVSRTVGELIMQIENQIVAHATDLSGEDLLASLPPPPTGTDLLVRPREVYSKTLATLLDLPSVNFAHLRVEELHAKVSEVVQADANRRAEIAKEFSKAPRTYNSAEMVELQERALQADAVSSGLVKLSKTANVRSLDDRNRVAPSAKEIHDFIAELVMNKDTWAYDEGMRKPGQRILNLVQGYEPEIRHLKDDPALRRTLPDFLRDGIGEILDRLHEVADLEDSSAQLEACAEIEEKISVLVKDAMDKMQEEATALFGISREDRRQPWQKSLNELNGSDGLSSSTSQGRFNKKLLDNYFKRSDEIEKRSMLASLIRNTDANSSQGKRVGELLKGAGPLLQKTLQGLSAGTFGPETQIALKDMKSKLLPIPDSVIKAQLQEIIRSSNGEILSIEVEKSIGQATVGQALLCRVRTKSHPVVGEYDVFKILRPNVQTAVQREYELFLQVAKELDEEEQTGNSQQKTFEGRYRTVLDEFDFTLEAANIDLCMGVYDKPVVTFGKDIPTKQYETIHSMDRNHSVPPTTGAIALQKVEGEPVDRMLERADREVEDLVKDIKVVTQPGPTGQTRTAYLAKDPGEALDIKVKLWRKRQALLEKHHEVTKLVDTWLERALFGDGIFHNDLHPGNVMLNGFDLSVIDYGNVGRLTKDQQTSLIYMFAGAMSGSEEDFLQGVEKVMGKAIDSRLRDQLKAAITEVFSKGTSDDVLPRMLGALSALKDFAIPIPEVIHNFAESMARLQTVVDGVVDEIEKIENISDEITVDENWFEETKLSEKWNNVGIDFLDDLKTLGRSLGTPGNKFDHRAAKDAAETYLKKIDSDGFKKTIEKQLKNVVFKMNDGGVEYLREIIRMLRSFPGALRSGFVGDHFNERAEKTCVDQLERCLDAYDKARASNRAKKVANWQGDIVRAFRETLPTFAKHLITLHEKGSGIWIDQGPIITVPSKAMDFVRCVSDSLMNRSELLQNSMARYMGIPQEKFDNVVKIMNEPPQNTFGYEAMKKARMANAAGTDLPKFMRLNAIGQKISAANVAKEEFERRLTTVMDMPLEEGKADTVRQHLSNYEMRKIERCAHEFRYPLSWGTVKDRNAAKTEIGGNADEIRQVFQTNLDALRKALGTEQLGEVQIKYFARVAAALTRDANFSEILADRDDKGMDELANGAADLRAMLQDYQNAIRDIPAEG